MSRTAEDLDLLFGALALQMDFITRDQLLQATQHRARLGRSLPDILLELGALTARRCTLVRELLDEYLAQHGGNVGECLNAVQEGQTGSSTSTPTRPSSSPTQISIQTPNENGEETRLPEPGHPLVPGLRFRILRQHKQGGLGRVYIAYDDELNREVALKEILPEWMNDPSIQRRFLQEAEITGRLEHPGIVPVYALGKYTDGRPYYVMKYVRGETLKDAIERFHKPAGQPLDPLAWQQGVERRLEIRSLLRRIVDVCNALQHAHDRGVLHRDLKPSNIMLGRHGETVVLDWGLAKSFTVSAGSQDSSHAPVQPRDQGSDDLLMTRPGSVIGTPQYASPEQVVFRSHEIGPRSDVYGLGATLYHLLTGKPPLDGILASEVQERVERGAIPSPREVHPGVPPALDAICRKAMALRTTDRYATPTELANEIERWLADEPVSVHRERLLERAGRWGRRYRSIVVSVALSLLLLMIVVCAALIREARLRYFADMYREQAVTGMANGGRLQERIFSLESRPLSVEWNAMVRERKLLETLEASARADNPEAATRLLLQRFPALAGTLQPEVQPARLPTSVLRGMAAVLMAQKSVLAGEAREAARPLLERAITLVRDSAQIPTNQAPTNQAPTNASGTGAGHNLVAAIDLARSLRALGEWYRVAGQPAEATAKFKEAADIVAAIHQEDPRNADAAVEYALILFQTGQLKLDQGQTEAAGDTFHQAQVALAGLETTDLLETTDGTQVSLGDLRTRLRTALETARAP